MVDMVLGILGTGLYAFIVALRVKGYLGKVKRRRS